jgi:hypothetical protein
VWAWRPWEFDLGGGVVADDALADSGVEGGAQSGADPVDLRRSWVSPLW